MLNSKIKNKIYSIVSISVLIATVISFIISINFLIKINNTSLNIDKKIVEEKTIILDVTAYNKIKDKLEVPKN
ncbi:hypothetical protein KAK05_01290 [Candidatus Parcubacteria bacterium]|nr:hypothetical protein [Candidatus Parcubacteria bacterium]